MRGVIWAIIATVAAVVIALGVVEVVHRAVRRLGRRSVLLTALTEHSHRPLQMVVTVLAVQVAIQPATAHAAGRPWRQNLLHLLALVLIAATGWLVASLLLVLQDTALTRFRIDTPDNREARRIRTQIVMLRRVTVAVVAIIALGVMLMTFPSVRAIGTTVLASAGVIGAVAALAAQSVLGNVVAGVQLAFSGAVRIDDVVVVEGEWGRIEELTLSYVVVHIWDDRRLILPTSYFTTKPFQNWTRTQSAVLGTAEFDVDWSVPVQDLREEMRRMVEGTDLWDGRVCVLQVTDAVKGTVRLRALVSAADSGKLWDLRCMVREHMIAWVRENRPTALPRTRAELADSRVTRPWRWEHSRIADGVGTNGNVPDDARVFGGSEDGEARSEAFVGPEEPVDAGSRR
ncbi:mechanosensitive ion channel family protein [Planosporangium mesophilum]|uniref:Mechanosensitive ion channel protein MscS n=1 Tax=Planosporangium mesophilum TaxID=689768 RepID=A0A8J3TGU4_9ACTN|nr:mechanosensitive ion channel domain-containing protein [Planosporangium mesophilum]GII25336.1 mechanosensitive ion channel protein MscS [Planosporangium mesophilum]